MESETSSQLFSRQNLLFLGFVVVLSCLTYFYRYQEPQAVFWDENYHIASAQKYLNRVYFMEQHPPLGKLLIAAGEKLLNGNPTATEKCLRQPVDQQTACRSALPGTASCTQFTGGQLEQCLRNADPGDNNFVNTDYGTNFTSDFSFVGYRFFPALLAWWTAPLLFLIFLLLTRSGVLAGLMSFLYVFDNALIVHLRGAMLESTLLFFCMLMVLTFLLLREFAERKKWFIGLSLLFGVTFGCIMTTKLLGLILVLLVPVYLFMLWPNVRKIFLFSGLFAIGFLVPYIFVWHLHFALGSSINTQLPDSGYYQASQKYQQILEEHRNASLTAFPVMLRDSLKFVTHYNNGAPRLDLCKNDENGSPFYFWPFGARSINYRWETPDGTAYRYLYLQANPVVWLTGLFALLLAICFLLAHFFLPVTERLRHPHLLLTFTGIYVAFMIAVSRIDRVMYLYHYFIPLLITFILAALVTLELRKFGRLYITETVRTGGWLILGALIFLSFQFYRPFTYYEPISNSEFQRRQVFSLWELSCVNCFKESGLVITCKDTAQ